MLEDNKELQAIYFDHNDVIVMGDGVGNNYSINHGSGLNSTLLNISFQKGPVPVNGVNGITNESLLAILVNRTKILNDKFPCEENRLAILHMTQALTWLEERTKGRVSRGVEGTLVV